MKNFFSKNRVGLGLTILFSLLLAGPFTQDVLGRTYEIGPSFSLKKIGDVPWADLEPGDTILIHYRPEPYREKWVIDRAGTEAAPIVIRGVPGPGGEMPVIDGRDAVTSRELDFWSEERGVINIGGSNWPNQIPAWIVIEGLDIRGARPPYRFLDDHGSQKGYSSSASSIYIIEGHHITIRNCVLHDCANGLFAAHASSDILVEGCWIYDNGMEGSGYQHNNYTEATRITFQYNHFGPLRQGCEGNNLKDRSAGTVIRYNWIEGGNRQLDLVDAGHESIYMAPEYRSTYVYGNILIERADEGNSQIIHYGGDSGNTSHYRKGTLYLYNNTIISRRMGNTTLLRLSTQDEECMAVNNIVYVTAPGSRLALLNRDGVLRLEHNWLKEGWRLSHEGGSIPGQVLDGGTNIVGQEPGFVDLVHDELHLQDGSPCRDAGTALDMVDGPYRPAFQYVKHQGHEPRPSSGAMDIGAFEATGGTPANRAPEILSFTAEPSRVDNPLTVISFTSSISDPDGDSLTAHLDFGDGTWRQQASGEHSYWKAGTYQAVLTVTDSHGASTSRSVTIMVEDAPPGRPQGVSIVPAED